jgi:hypothetical protein
MTAAGLGQIGSRRASTIPAMPGGQHGECFVLTATDSRAESRRANAAFLSRDNREAARKCLCGDGRIITVDRGASMFNPGRDQVTGGIGRCPGGDDIQRAEYGFGLGHKSLWHLLPRTVAQFGCDDDAETCADPHDIIVASWCPAFAA